jgi:hypothetical protein
VAAELSDQHTAIPRTPNWNYGSTNQKLAPTIGTDDAFAPRGEVSSGSLSRLSPDELADVLSAICETLPLLPERRAAVAWKVYTSVHDSTFQDLLSSAGTQDEEVEYIVSILSRHLSDTAPAVAQGLEVQSEVLRWKLREAARLSC